MNESSELQENGFRHSLVDQISNLQRFVEDINHELTVLKRCDTRGRSQNQQQDGPSQNQHIRQSGYSSNDNYQNQEDGHQEHDENEVPYQATHSPRGSNATRPINNRCNLSHYLEGDLRPPSRGPTEELQEEFAIIKDSVSRIRLPPFLKLTPTRTGIARENQVAFNIAAKCSQFSQTSLKILSMLHEGDPVVRDLIVIQAAQVRYLADELEALSLSAGPFPEQTSRVYRLLRNNPSFGDPEHLSTLRSAVDISSSIYNQSYRGGRGGYRGSWRGGYRGGYRGGFRGNRGYRGGSRGNRMWNQQSANFSFPDRRPQQDNQETSV